ncbi:MAG: thiolase family protein [Candidatus Omnitrophota bacterium]|nr:thiolase family protein [Candidatus Omnitrophota bacterium]
MMSRIAIVDGIRTPFVKAWTDFDAIPAHELGRIAVRELLERTGISPDKIDEVIFGAVSQPPEASNVARVISLLSAIPKEKRAYTISRNCASGFESVTSAAEKINAGIDEIVIAGGTESMSNIPLLYRKDTAKIFLKISKAKSMLEKLALFLSFRPRHFLKPEIGLALGLTDPVCGLNMGQTAEVLAKEYAISRREQDEFALESHKRVQGAQEKLREEIVPVWVPPKYEKVIERDNGVRENITLEDLAKLRPYFDRYSGTVTVGNACQVSDGACALLVMKEEKAKELGFTPLGFIRAYDYVGVEPGKMGIGPAFAIPEVLKKANLKLNDIGLLEINEAFAAQVIACEREMSRSGIGKIERNILNVNGGAIALGHPVGTTGARLILTLLKEMKRRSLHLGLASLCVGGGQGGAIILER